MKTRGHKLSSMGVIFTRVANELLQDTGVLLAAAGFDDIGQPVGGHKGVEVSRRVPAVDVRCDISRELGRRAEHEEQHLPDDLRGPRRQRTIRHQARRVHHEARYKADLASASAASRCP